jgi:hypothetical protein
MEKRLVSLAQAAMEQVVAAHFGGKTVATIPSGW